MEYGTTVYFNKLTLNWPYRLRNQTSIFQSETFAITELSVCLKARISLLTHLIISVDSQEAIQSAIEIPDRDIPIFTDGCKMQYGTGTYSHMLALNGCSNCNFQAEILFYRTNCTYYLTH